MERIRVLFLSANPRGTGTLGLGKELREIKARIDGVKENRVDLTSGEAVRIRDLSSLLLKIRPHIVHFSGHGVVVRAGSSSQDEDAELLFDGDVVDSESAPREALANLFILHKETVRCVVLNTCYSDRLAYSIIDGVDFSIGVSGRIQDETAIVFSASFYEALAYGRTVQGAYSFGQNAAQLVRQYDGNAIKLFIRESKLPFEPLVIPAEAQKIPLTIRDLKNEIRKHILPHELDSFLQDFFSETQGNINRLLSYNEKLTALFDCVRDLRRIRKAIADHRDEKSKSTAEGT